MKIITTKDYFKNFRLNKPENDTGTQPYYEEATCKLCGEKIKGLSPLGALHYMANFPPKLFEDYLEEHLELHIKEKRYLEQLGKPTNKTNK